MRLTLDLLRQVLDLRTHTYYCRTTALITYIIRLAVHVESAVAFLLLLSTGEHESLRLDQLPGLKMGAARKELDKFFAQSQELLRTRVRPLLRTWLSELEVEEQEKRKFEPQKVDQICLEMASVHSHLILCLRNIAPKQMTYADVRQLLKSFMFLQRRHVWNRKPEPPMFELPVSEPQLFDIMQCKRRAIVEWLAAREEGEGALRVQRLLHEVFEVGTGELHSYTAWGAFAGAVNRGRYATVDFYVLGEGLTPEERPPQPAWIQKITDRDPIVEVNLQLLQVMMRGRFLTALSRDFMEQTDFVHLFGRTQSTVQAVMAGNFENMRERILISHPYHLQLWITEDTRDPPTPPMHSKPYKARNLPVHLRWVGDMFEPVRLKYPKYERMERNGEVREINWYFTEKELPPATSHTCLLLAQHPFEFHPIFEAMVYRDHHGVQIFAIVNMSHGRRWYRTLEHCTDANVTLHYFQPSVDDLQTTWRPFFRYEALELQQPVAKSMVICRERITAHRKEATKAEREAEARKAKALKDATERQAIETSEQEQARRAEELKRKGGMADDFDLSDDEQMSSRTDAWDATEAKLAGDGTRTAAEDDESDEAEDEEAISSITIPSDAEIDELRNQIGRLKKQYDALETCFPPCGCPHAIRPGALYRVTESYARGQLNEADGSLAPLGQNVRPDQVTGFYVQGAGEAMANGLYAKDEDHELKPRYKLAAHNRDGVPFEYYIQGADAARGHKRWELVRMQRAKVGAEAEPVVLYATADEREAADLPPTAEGSWRLPQTDALPILPGPTVQALLVHSSVTKAAVMQHGRVVKLRIEDDDSPTVGWPNLTTSKDQDRVRFEVKLVRLSGKVLVGWASSTFCAPRGTRRRGRLSARASAPTRAPLALRTSPSGRPRSHVPRGARLSLRRRRRRWRSASASGCGTSACQ